MAFGLMVSGALFAADSGSGGYSSGGGDGSTTSVEVAAEMRFVRKQIEAENYRAAIQTLNRVVQQNHRNADAWNLLGFSARKLGKYKKASRAYKKALKLNPDHLGALSYQGELFIAVGEIAAARQNLERVKALCETDCWQMEKLEKALSGL